MVRSAGRALAVLGALVLSLVGCGGHGGGLADPGLTKVKVEVANARAATVTADEGGTVTATGSNGVVYTLTVPADAVDVDTTVSMYPVTDVVGLPVTGGLTAGVELLPEGLVLHAPATLTIQLPTATDTKQLIGIAAKRDAEEPQGFPAVPDGQTVTLTLVHFSLYFLGNPQLDALIQQADPTLGEFDASKIVFAYQRFLDNNVDPTSDYVLALHDWYDRILVPKIIRYLNDTTLGPNGLLSDFELLVPEYDAWLAAIKFCQLTAPPGPHVEDRVQDSIDRLDFALNHAIDVCNQECRQDPSNVQRALSLSAFALSQQPPAQRWGVGQSPTDLSLEGILNRVCVKVVIESRDYSASQPGDNGVVAVNAGISIDGNPVRHDVPLRIKLSGSAPASPSSGLVNAQGRFTAVETWPSGVDPIRINILANVDSTSAAIRRISVFDRITKTSSNNNGGGGGGGTDISGRYDGTVTDNSAGAGGGVGPARIFLTQQGSSVGVELQSGTGIGNPTGPQFTATLNGTSLHFASSDSDFTFDGTISGGHLTATQADVGNGGDRFDFDVTKSGP